MQGVICHLVGRDDWVAAGSGAAGYRPASLDAEGFIHFSTPGQVAATANRFYAGRDDLLLVLVDRCGSVSISAHLRSPLLPRDGPGLTGHSHAGFPFHSHLHPGGCLTVGSAGVSRLRPTAGDVVRIEPALRR